MEDREQKSVCRRPHVKTPTHPPVMTASFLDRKFIEVIYDQSKIGQKKSLSLVDWQFDEGRQGGFKNFLLYAVRDLKRLYEIKKSPASFNKWDNLYVLLEADRDDGPPHTLILHILSKNYPM